MCGNGHLQPHAQSWGVLAFLCCKHSLHAESQRAQNVARRAFSPLNPAYEQYLGTLKAHLATHDGLPAAVHQTQLLAYNLLQQQAASLAYIDIFQLLTVISLACIPFVFLLRNVAIKNGECGHALAAGDLIAYGYRGVGVLVQNSQAGYLMPGSKTSTSLGTETSNV